MATTVRKQAPRPARPAGRYWKGKAPKGAADLSSSESDDERQVPQEEGDIAFAGEQEFLHAEYDEDEEQEQGRRAHGAGKMSLALKNVNISKEGKVTIAGKVEVGRTEMEGVFASLDHYQNSDNYPEELSEETEEETDAKDASQGESDEVCQPSIRTPLSLNDYLSLANTNLSQKTRNPKSSSALYLFQSTAFSPPCDVFGPLNVISQTKPRHRGGKASSS
jgi:hypothetical protein